MDKIAKAVSKINALTLADKPFLFVIDFDTSRTEIYEPDEIPGDVLFAVPGFTNAKQRPEKTPEFSFDATPPEFADYKKAFNHVMQHIQEGNTFLLNLTFRSKLETNLSLEQIFRHSHARYKLYFKDEFVVFSPETFIQIEEGKISCCPMKGTIDASLENAGQALLSDPKETAEHHTIVDLIRNDLAMVSENVEVEKFRYLEKIKTHKGDILQMSSRISGKLPPGHRSRLGEVLFKILPAGSISGAPKPKTLEIIRQAENHNRGFYTGIFGYFDGRKLDSAVMIRFIENIDGVMYFKSGGGITAMSDAKKEYDELIRKIYVPVY